MSVVDWLLDADPAIRWQVLRDLVDAPAEIVSAARARGLDLKRRVPTAARASIVHASYGGLLILSSLGAFTRNESSTTAHGPD